MLVASVGTALPPHRYSQEEILEAFRAAWGTRHHNAARVDRLHRAVQVGARHLALPLEAYPALQGFGEANEAFIRVATEIGEAALRRALAEAGLDPRDLSAIFFTTVTGVATPSIDARLMNRLDLRADLKRLPLFGLGCVAGAAGIARLHDYLRAYPGEAAALLAVELCSLTVQRGDLSVANLVATGLFGDGAAAVVGLGAEHPAAGGRAGPRVLATRSSFYRETERVMGWDVGGEGLKIVLDASVPDVVRARLRGDVDGFLGERGLRRADIDLWVCHPGGPKVLEAFEEALDLERGALALTWRSLGEVGNLSSASVLFVLRDTLAERRPRRGARGLMVAMGPGFCSELVLLEWQ